MVKDEAATINWLYEELQVRGVYLQSEFKQNFKMSSRCIFYSAVPVAWKPTEAAPASPPLIVAAHSARGDFPEMHNDWMVSLNSSICQHIS